MPVNLKLPSKFTFPAAEVEACIRDALAIQADDQAVLRQDDPAAAPGAVWEPEIDSLVVVELICAIEELLGLTLSESFVPKGGYASAGTCVRDLLAEARAVWDQLHTTGG